MEMKKKEETAQVLKIASATRMRNNIAGDTNHNAEGAGPVSYSYASSTRNLCMDTNSWKS